MAFLPPPKKTPLYLWIKITQKETKCADICFVSSKYAPSTVLRQYCTWGTTSTSTACTKFQVFEEYSIKAHRFS